MAEAAMVLTCEIGPGIRRGGRLERHRGEDGERQRPMYPLGSKVSSFDRSVRGRRAMEHVLGGGMKSLIASLGLALAIPAAAASFAIRAGAVIDPERGTVERDQVVLVTDGKIQAVGAGVAIPAGATVIDLSHEWLMPGLMDAHTHLTLTEVVGGDAPFESFYIKESTVYRALRGLRNAQVLLAAGFTTIRDVGNEAQYAMEDVQRAVDGGMFPGTHDRHLRQNHRPVWRAVAFHSGRAGAVLGLRIHRCGRPGRDPQGRAPEPLLRRPRDQARARQQPLSLFGRGIARGRRGSARRERPVSVHVYGGAAADNAIEAGVDSIEHGFFLTDAQLQRIKDKGIFLTSTDYPRAHLDIIGTSGGIFPPPEVLAPAIVDRLRRAHRIGVKPRIRQRYRQ